jgi:hypothetical protein
MKLSEALTLLNRQFPPTPDAQAHLQTLILDEIEASGIEAVCKPEFIVFLAYAYQEPKPERPGAPKLRVIQGGRDAVD